MGKCLGVLFVLCLLGFGTALFLHWGPKAGGASTDHLPGDQASALSSASATKEWVNASSDALSKKQMHQGASTQNLAFASNERKPKSTTETSATTTTFTPEQRGVHRVFPPQQAGDPWRGYAPGPSVGKLTANIGLNWEWTPNTSGQPGLLSIMLTPGSSVDAIDLSIHPASTRTQLAGPSTWRSGKLESRETWITKHLITPGSQTSLMRISFRNGPLSRSVSIPLGWDGIGDDRPMSEKSVPGVIVTDDAILMPAQVKIDP
jgi:hypothetical protein